MGGGEGVVHIDIAKRRHLAREHIVVGLLAALEAHVLAQDRLTGRDRDAGKPVLAEPDLAAEQRGQRRGDRCQGQRCVIAPFLGAPEVRDHQHPGPGPQGLLDGGERGPDAGIVGDTAVLDGDIQVLADQDPLPCEGEIRHGEHRTVSSPQRACIQATVVSSMRFENPHSLSYQASTLTNVRR